NDSHVGSRIYLENDRVEERVSGGPHADATSLNPNTFRRHRNGSGRLLTGEMSGSKVGCAERLQHSQNCAAIRWILPRDQRELVSERGQIQKPINLQQQSGAAT